MSNNPAVYYKNTFITVIILIIDEITFHRLSIPWYFHNILTLYPSAKS